MDFTARNVAKYAVKAAIHYTVSARVEQIIIDNTKYEEDDFVVDLGSHVVGWAVSDKLKPLTDKAVDFTFDKAKSLKRNKTEETPEEK